MNRWVREAEGDLGKQDSDGNPNSSLVTNLTYTQALILLGIPEEERDEFIAEHDVESMTKLELQQAVKDRDQKNPCRARSAPFPYGAGKSNRLKEKLPVR